jgi:VIT1/CCC1 family predicted Fe2+/Mn2+ transporter
VRTRWKSPLAWLHTAAFGRLDAATVRSLVVDGNDGIIATAGIIEGFVGAGATGRAIPIAAFSAMVAGGIAVGGAKYAEEAVERDARRTLLDEQRRLIELSPDQEMAELAHAYEAKGLSASLAHAVATELTAADALAAHADVKHRLALTDAEPAPLFAAVCSGIAYALGAGVPLLAALLVPDAWRETVTFAAAFLSLVVTSVVLALAGATHVLRTLARSVLIGAMAILLTLAVGSLFEI